MSGKGEIKTTDSSDGMAVVATALAVSLAADQRTPGHSMEDQRPVDAAMLRNSSESRGNPPSGVSSVFRVRVEDLEGSISTNWC